MTQKRPESARLIRQVVRGDRPITDLSELGIGIQIIDEKWQIESPPMEAVKLHISDVAHGLVKHASNPRDMKKWATLVLCGSGFLDLSECELQTGWEVLLNSLWDAMETGTFASDALYLAQELGP